MSLWRETQLLCDIISLKTWDFKDLKIESNLSFEQTFLIKIVKSEGLNSELCSTLEVAMKRLELAPRSLTEKFQSPRLLSIHQWKCLLMSYPWRFARRWVRSTLSNAKSIQTVNLIILNKSGHNFMLKDQQVWCSQSALSKAVLFVNYETHWVEGKTFQNNSFEDLCSWLDYHSSIVFNAWCLTCF